jgi:ATP-dependent DNA helicase RecG
LSVYPLTAGITSRWLRNKIHDLLENVSLPDPLENPPFISLQDAYSKIHFPTTSKEKDLADKRLAYNSHLQINLTNLLERHAYGNSLPLKINFQIHKLSFTKIPFTLTPDQEKTIKSLYKDLRSAEFTHRLIEGDTGSGKTATLVFATNQCLSQNYSCAILAPTETCSPAFRNFKASLYPENLELVTGNSHPTFSTKATLFIGTHSLINHLPVNLVHSFGFCCHRRATQVWSPTT